MLDSILISHDSKTALKSHFLCENARILLYGMLLRTKLHSLKK